MIVGNGALEVGRSNSAANDKMAELMHLHIVEQTSCTSRCGSRPKTYNVDDSDNFRLPRYESDRAENPHCFSFIGENRGGNDGDSNVANSTPVRIKLADVEAINRPVPAEPAWVVMGRSCARSHPRKYPRSALPSLARHQHTSIRKSASAPLSPGGGGPRA